MKNHWNCTIKRKAELGLFSDEVDSVSLDIQQFVEGEVQYLLTLANSKLVFSAFMDVHHTTNVFFPSMISPKMANK